MSSPRVSSYLCPALPVRAQQPGSGTSHARVLGTRPGTPARSRPMRPGARSPHLCDPRTPAGPREPPVCRDGPRAAERLIFGPRSSPSQVTDLNRAAASPEPRSTVSTITLSIHTMPHRVRLCEYPMVRRVTPPGRAGCSRSASKPASPYWRGIPGQRWPPPMPRKNPHDAV